MNSNDQYDETPLHLACTEGNLECVKILQTHAADIDNKNEDEQTPCHLAAINGQVEVLKFLIENDPSAIFDKDENDKTSLHLASENKHAGALEVLLQNGAHVQEKNSKDWTALDCAASVGATQCVKVLLEFDAPVDPIDRTHTTPLHLACEGGHHKTVEILMENGADVTLEDIYGQNALEIAISRGRKSATKAILDSNKWRDAMRATNKMVNPHGTIVPDTPMRMLIRTFPDLAEDVFDKCISAKKLKNNKGHDDTNDKKSVDFDYEFIDDTFCLKFMEESEQYEYCPVDENNQCQLFPSPYNNNGAVRMTNHPLMIMANQKQKVIMFFSAG